MDVLSLIVGFMAGGLLAFILAGLCVCASRDDDAKMLAEAMSLLDDCKDCGWGSSTWQKGVKSLVRDYYQEAG